MTTTLALFVMMIINSTNSPQKSTQRLLNVNALEVIVKIIAPSLRDVFQGQFFLRKKRKIVGCK